jgi:hypothetical protein
MSDVLIHNEPYFDTGGWTASTDFGLCWKLFKSKKKQCNPLLVGEAKEVVKEVLRTGQPPFGGWG